MNIHSPSTASSLATLFRIFNFCVVAMATFQLTFAQSGSADRLKLPAGFKAELLYRVAEQQGSWVSITNDSQGRLLASDQYGKLYRITPNNDGQADVEEIELNIGFAQGRLAHLAGVLDRENGRSTIPIAFPPSSILVLAAQQVSRLAQAQSFRPSIKSHCLFPTGATELFIPFNWQITAPVFKRPRNDFVTHPHCRLPIS